MNMFKVSSAKTPEEYLNRLEEPRKSEMEQLYTCISSTIPNEKPFIMSRMIAWKPYHYQYASGREGDWFIVGLASQKNYISVYVCAAAQGEYLAEKYNKELGRVNVGRSCIRLKKVSDLDLPTLKKVIKEGIKSTPQL